MKPETAIVQQAEETEQQLIDRASQYVGRTNWIVGECASKWTQRYARGRTDDDFAQQIGGDVSGDQVRQRRIVYETFGDVSDTYPKLSWSHFYSAVNWDDAAECLQWADELQASVAEMKAWRRSQHGEDLETPADDTRWNEEEKQDARFDVSEPEAPNDDELPSLQSMQGIAKETIDKQAVEGVRELRESKEATPRRDGPSPIAKVFDTLEHSIQQLRDYQELVSIREKANHLAAMVTEKIRRIDEEG